MGSVSGLLSSGTTIPLIGLGTGTGAATQNADDIKAAVLTALRVGYTHFDTASLYGSEPALGEALDYAFRSSLVKRDQIFVTTKLGCEDHGDPVSALKTSLKKLQMEYVDLYVVHWPVKLRKGFSQPNPKDEDFLPVDIKSTWQGMEKCVELGLAKHIGLSNFSCKKTQDLLAYAKISPAVNQVEMHPLWQQKKLRDYCKLAKIHVSAWSPLGAPGTPWGSYALMENPVIQGIAQKHGKTPAQVCLRWGVEQGATVLPKSSNKDRIAENFQIFDWSLSAEDHEKISKLEQRKILRAEQLVNPANGPYKTVEELWDGEI